MAGGRTGDRARERAPRLVLRFALLTALGLTVAVGVIVIVVRQAYAAQAEQRAIGHARLTSELVLNGQLRPVDLVGPVSATRRHRLDQLFEGQVLRDGIAGAAIYGPHGRRVYADGKQPVGPVNGGALRDALAGRTVSRIVPGKAGQMLETYIPLTLRQGEVRGVVVLGESYAPIAASARHSTLIVAGVLEGVLACLFLLLVPPLRRASQRIGAQVDELDWLATHDELTGLVNRVGFRRAIQQTVDANGSAAMALVDLDSFHEFNDVFGPDWGDAILAQSAERLRAIAAAATVARTGEDEFGLLFPNAAPHTLKQAEHAIRAALAEPVSLGSQNVNTEVRIGSVLLPEHGNGPDVLLRRAGVALSIAKQTGAPSYTYDPDHDASDISRLTLVSELRLGLRDQQLVVHYQPQADLATGAIRGVEALIRWHHPERGLLPASAFLGAAEQNGLTAEIRRIVIKSAAAQWAAWNQAGLKLDIAVNLSALDLLDPDLPNEIEAALQHHSMPAEYLVLEITERTLLRTERHGNPTLAALQQLGTRLAVDDFGTGYSSLAALRNLNAQQVKLDQTFLQDIPGDTANQAIIRSTIELAHTLRATVVAEGVETPAQWNHLKQLGCDIAQGFLIGHPTSPDQLHIQTRRTLHIAA